MVRGGSVYIGKKTDPLDMKLAEFINHPSVKPNMKLLFIRESEGVYRYGEKRVILKLERGDKIKVRIGGGFINIDEFIEKTTPIEVNKITRKDTISTVQNMF